MSTDNLRMPQHAANPIFRREISLGNVPGALRWEQHPHTSSLHLPALLCRTTSCSSPCSVFPPFPPQSSWLLPLGNHNPLDWDRCHWVEWGEVQHLAPGFRFAVGAKTPSWVKTMSFGASWESHLGSSTWPQSGTNVPVVLFGKG